MPFKIPFTQSPLPAGKSVSRARPFAKPDRTQAVDADTIERRKLVRPLPVPDAVENDGDTDWDAFQALISDQPKR
jgi:hypothetical protein